MSSSSDDIEDQEEANIFDQLRSIKAFTVDQLYLLHPDVGCQTTSSTKTNKTSQQPQANDNFTSDTYHDQNLYQNLTDYEHLRHELYKLKSQVKFLNRKTFEHIEKVWYFEEQTLRKVGMCQQGKIAETTFKYKRALINKKELDFFDPSFNELIKLIREDYINYSFESQMRIIKIETQLSDSIHNLDENSNRERLKHCITTLTNFIKHLGDSKSDFVLKCRKWLRELIKTFLQTKQVDDYKFVIGQLCKGPAGTADWSSDLIEYKPQDQFQEFETKPQYITHCSALLNELFNNLKSEVGKRRVTISINNDATTSLTATNGSSSNEQNWSLIDPRFVNCDEELPSNSSNILTECDVIKFCLKIPIAQIFKEYVKKCLESNTGIDGNENDKNYEYIMLKLLTIGTVIIKTYQIGLETFNSIQYGNLIEYLSSQIRRTVIVLSDQWTEFKRRLKGIDNALLMRLQVEYDNFILRSILIILELRQSGIWRHLSRIEPDDLIPFENPSGWSTDSIRPAFAKLLQVTGLTATENLNQQQTPSKSEQVVKSSKHLANSKSLNSLTYEFSIEWFKEVSESMLWHILWQFYHNAFVSSCDYHSDNFWIEKFQENSVVYLFVNKIRDSPRGECSYLLNSVTSMLLSRTRADSKFVTFIATQLFNLSFKHIDLKDKITKKGTISLIRCAEKFPTLISLYLSFLVDEETIDEDIVSLFWGCSLMGWICNDDEFCILASWLVESPLTSLHNKIARIIISKLLLNGSSVSITNPLSSIKQPLRGRRYSKKSLKQLKEHCFVDLKLRRRFALVLYEASVRHLPEPNDYRPQSCGSKVELALSNLFCENTPTSEANLLELAVSTNYQQFYVWVWRLLFTFRLHILNQPETDWNDIQTRSGTSRSIKNTVLFDDSFHPVPTIQDSECLSLSEGVKNQQPVASYIYLSMTDATWRAKTLDDCLNHLISMTTSGHLSPSLMAFKFLTICHLNDLSETMAKDQRCIEYITAIIKSDFDITRLASMIILQMQNLKQYRQLQLSQFYITVLLEVAVVILKQLSSSWFSTEEHKLEKIACLLDYIIRFNFPTQRPEIIRKFYDCSYSAQSCRANSSWMGSLFSSNTIQNASSSKREFITTLHVLTQKFKKYSWLRWVTTECDTLRLEKIWEDIVQHLSANEEANIDLAIKKVCPQVNSSILKSTIPIYSWLSQILDMVETDLNHPLCPLIWYNFFLNYFSNTLNGGAIGLRLISQETIYNLQSRLDSLFNYHLYKHRHWTSGNSGNNFKQNSLAQLYRAYRLWLQDPSLQDVYVDMDRLKPDYLVSLLKTVMESTSEVACLQYIDIHGIETQNRNLCQIWLTSTILEGNHLIKDMKFVGDEHNDSMELITSVDDEASDAVSLIVKPSTTFNNHDENNILFKNSDDDNQKIGFGELFNSNDNNQKSSLEDRLDTIKKNCSIVFKESSLFGSSIVELDKVKNEIIELVQQLYVNKKVEYIKPVACFDGNECSGPARIKFEVEVATIDDRKSGCIQDRQAQCEGMVEELLVMPTNKVVKASILIENSVRQLVNEPENAKKLIEQLLCWLSEPKIFNQLDKSYYTADHLLKSILEILSNTTELDTYNTTLINVCLEHPGSVQIFSPFLSPSSCSCECFLNLYKKVCMKHNDLKPTALFVILSKFYLNSWLKNNNNKEMLHEMIKTTCQALGQMGKEPDESCNDTFDLFKRHLQVELALPDRRKPEEIFLVMNQFLLLMDDQMLSPGLWMEFLTILGLEKQITPNNISDNRSIVSNSIRQQLNNSSIRNSPGKNSAPDQLYCFMQQMEDYEQDQFDIVALVEDIAKLADRQTLLNYEVLNGMMRRLAEFINERESSIDITLLELYNDYLEQFGIVMISITFMWLKAYGERYPDNHDLIWKQFMDLWERWVFLSKNCQNVGKSSYSLMSNQFVAAIRYMIFKIPDNTQMILKSILNNLNIYIKTTKEVVYLELTILQRCLKHLPWSSLIASPQDFENLASLSEQENYNVSELICHILLQINTKECLQKISDQESSKLPQVAERLATTIVLQSSNLRGFRLYDGGYFAFIPADKVAIIATQIMPRMEFANLEHSQNNKLLINLLKFMCIRLEKINQPGGLNNQRIYHIGDSFERSLIYANFVSDYLVSLIKNHPPIIKYHKPYLFAVMDDSLRELKILLSPDVDLAKKTALYESLLSCCSSNQIDEKSRIIIAKSLLKSNMLKNHPIVVMEVFYAICQIISDPRVLVYTIEKMIMLYLNNNGYYEKVWKSFKLSVLPGDLYLEACVNNSAPLALLVYFEALIHNGCNNSMTESSQSTSLLSNNRILASFITWLSRLEVRNSVKSSNQVKSNDLRLSITWLKLLHMLETNLVQYIESDTTVINNHHTSDQADGDNNMSQKSNPTTKTNDVNNHMFPNHLALVNFIKHLISIYDASNPGGIWSYLKFSRGEEDNYKISIVALAIACFLSDKILECLKVLTGGKNEYDDNEHTTSEPVNMRKKQLIKGGPNKQLGLLREEVFKLRKNCLSKLTACRDSKSTNNQYIESLIETVQNEKIQYSDGLVLIVTFLKNLHHTYDASIVDKILA